MPRRIWRAYRRLVHGEGRVSEGGSEQTPLGGLTRDEMRIVGTEIVEEAFNAEA
jgi:hypothetical protein